MRGSLQSSGPGDALASLRRRALFVTALQPARSSGGAILGALSLAAVKRSAMVSFARCMAALLEAGVPLRRSLQLTLERCADARLREALRAVLCEVESGAPLSSALGKRPREFAKIFSAMVRAGESGGDLDGAFGRLSSLLERDFASSKRLATALAYPAFVCAAACALILFLLTTIVPSFATMYAQMHVPLPRQTAVLMSFGNTLRQPYAWVIAVTALACLAAGALQIRAHTPVAEKLLVTWMRVPAVGAVIRKSVLARVAGAAASLLRSGVDLVEALDVVADVSGNEAYAASLRRVRDEVLAGGTLAGAFESDGLYEPLFSAMVGVGEESGALDALLARIAEYYERDVEAAIGTLIALAEPAMILVLGTVVGSVVAAVLVPLYSLIGSIK